MFSTLIENQAQARNTIHRDGVGFLCSSCWQHKPVSGYGVDNEGRLHCYDCCHKQDIEEMRDRSKPFGAYLSGDGRRITNWPGGTLGEVFHYSESRTGFHRSTQAFFRVRDVHGQWWSGRGAGKGFYCTLRPMKTPKH